jgi:hypothetical protein
MTDTKTIDTTGLKLIAIKSQHTRHKGCSYRGTNVMIDECDAAEGMTLAAIELAKVHHEIESMNDAAGGGNIGCGSRELVAIFEDADGDECEYNLDEINVQSLGLPTGKIRPETVAELSEPSWDGCKRLEADVSGIAAFAGLRDSYGFWNADDWLMNATFNQNETAEMICDDAASNGVFLSEEEVQEWIDEHKPKEDE